MGGVRAARVLCLGWSESCLLIGHTFLSSRLGCGRSLGCIYIHDWPKIRKFIALSARVRGTPTPLIKSGSSPGNENELRAAGDLRPATAPWALWEGCCSKLSECPAGVPPLWWGGWRGGPNACQPGRRAARLWRLWATCPGRRSPASPGTCSPNGGCHGCMSYRYEDAPERCKLQKKNKTKKPKQLRLKFDRLPQLKLKEWLKKKKRWMHFWLIPSEVYRIFEQHLITCIYPIWQVIWVSPECSIITLSGFSITALELVKFHKDRLC